MMIWKAGVDQARDYVNKAGLEFTGHTQAELVGEGWKKNIHPEDLPSYVKGYTSAFTARQEFKVEYRLLRAGGEYRWFLDHGVPYSLPPGKFSSYIGFCTDITDRKHAEVAWRGSERRCRGQPHRGAGSVTFLSPETSYRKEKSVTVAFLELLAFLYPQFHRSGDKGENLFFNLVNN